MGVSLGGARPVELERGHSRILRAGQGKNVIGTGVKMTRLSCKGSPYSRLRASVAEEIRCLSLGKKRGGALKYFHR